MGFYLKFLEKVGIIPNKIPFLVLFAIERYKQIDIIDNISHVIYIYEYRACF